MRAFIFLIIIIVISCGRREIPYTQSDWRTADSLITDIVASSVNNPVSPYVSKGDTIGGLVTNVFGDTTDVYLIIEGEIVHISFEKTKIYIDGYD